MDKVYIVLGIYYEEDFYEAETILHINKTMKGVIKELLLSFVQPEKNRYDEYKIKEYYVLE